MVQRLDKKLLEFSACDGAEMTEAWVHSSRTHTTFQAWYYTVCTLQIKQPTAQKLHVLLVRSWHCKTYALQYCKNLKLILETVLQFFYSQQSVGRFNQRKNSKTNEIFFRNLKISFHLQYTEENFFLDFISQYRYQYKN
jgi:hypothetical protein